LQLKYFTIKDYESIEEFVLRIRFEVKGEYYCQSISPVMGKGVQVMTVVNSNLTNPVKLEVNTDDIDELHEYYPLIKVREKSNKIKQLRRFI